MLSYVVGVVDRFLAIINATSPIVEIAAAILGGATVVLILFVRDPQSRRVMARMLFPTFAAPFLVPLWSAISAGWDQGKAGLGAGTVTLLLLCALVLAFSVRQAARSPRWHVAVPPLVFVLFALGLFFLAGGQLVTDGHLD